MANYVINIKTNIALLSGDLVHIENIVYDVITALGGSTKVDNEGIGLTDVEAKYN